MTPREGGSGAGNNSLPILGENLQKECVRGTGEVTLFTCKKFTLCPSCFYGEPASTCGQVAGPALAEAIQRQVMVTITTMPPIMA